MLTAVITGASSGIGRSVAMEMAKSGKYGCIALNSGHNEKNLIETAEGLREICRKYGADTDKGPGIDSTAAENNTAETQILTVFGDISENITARALIKKTISVTGRIDVLVNSAAISHVGLLMDMTPDEWQKTVAVNLNSVYNTCHEVLPFMVREKAGRIVNISSVWGLVGASCEVAYSATKGGVNAFTRALAKEMAPSGISVNAIAFGAVDTRMNDNLSEEEKNELADSISIGRFATPEEAAETVMKLLEMPEYLTGEVIKCDGGWI
ncbi:MAG: SDR family NAD(P)-dependent oxidoreductase [Eubacterium sp.]|nr:SDR family NAD(P)-dependent oxidoreductase [Eubacterium sp.]